MSKIRVFLSALLMATLCQSPSALAWDPQPTNPFPGVPFEGEIPGYTVEVPCRADGDCGIGIVPVVNCPAWSAADGRNGYANDGPPGDPHKKVGLARRFCRNSWTPPNTAADDEDFRNRQNLAIAAATLESQAYNAAHPGQQKCVTWGPIVHANGISTASGGVCANPVGTTPSGTTVQVPPSPVGSTSSESSGANESSGRTSNSESSTSTTGTSTSNTTSTTPKAVVPDYSQYGVGKPFTKKLEGSKSTSECPSGYQAASNYISGVGSSGLTECWPENAWAAYSIGGTTWSAFKQSNGSLDVQTEQARVIQVNAIRVLALQNAQKAANDTPGLKRCITWSGFGESGQECAYIPLQSNSGTSTPQTSGSTSPQVETNTATTQIKSGSELPGTRKYSSPGVSRLQWESSVDYSAISCPIGSAKASGIDLNGTAISSDDRWFTYCVPTNLPTTAVDETSTVVSTTPNTSNESSTVTTNQPTNSETSTSVPNNQSNNTSSNTGSNTQPEVEVVAVEVKGSSKEIAGLIPKITDDKRESSALTAFLKLVDKTTTSTKTNSVKIPSSTRVEVLSESLTPKICKVESGTVVAVSKGLCEYAVILIDSDGNKYTVVKSINFRK